MQDTFCLSVTSKFSFGAATGKERGLQLLTSLAADMKSAEEGKEPYMTAHHQHCTPIYIHICIHMYYLALAGFFLFKDVLTPGAAVNAKMESASGQTRG